MTVQDLLNALVKLPGSHKVQFIGEIRNYDGMYQGSVICDIISVNNLEPSLAILRSNQYGDTGSLKDNE